MSNPTEIQVARPSQIERGETFAPRNLAEAFKFADMVLLSGMAPRSYLEIYDKALKDGLSPEQAQGKAQAAVVVALQFGAEIGLQPMQSLQCVANINGNPSVWGDGALALVQNSGLMESIREDDFDTIKANKKAVCAVKRKGDPEVKTVTFSYEDAEKAGIIKRGVWLTYPYRMCMMRARAFALRDKFPDVLKGLKIAEEVMDMVDAEPMPEPPKIQPTVVVPTAAPALAATTPPATGAQQPAQQPTETPKPQTSDFTEEQIANAKLFFRTYQANGKLPEEAKAWLKENFPYATDSRYIKPEDFPACMKWAETPKAAPATEENPDAEPVEE